ncbi:MAG: Z1 domain-containing protein [Acidimicrobiaceae bacterium]|nr:Z1 domain-containing protein [Acidimicrobiaceae bacterium]
MTSVGDDQSQIERFLRSVRAIAESGGDAEIAISAAPEHLRERLTVAWRELTSEQAGLHELRPVDHGSVLAPAGPRAWFRDYDPANGYHWPRLRNWLRDDRGWSLSMLDSLDRSSDSVLSHLEDPRSSGPSAFRVTGLVVGRVQSGKTANYTALIAKAVDVGYRLIIVMTGLHNQLRWQTQLRLGRELGFDESDGGIGRAIAGRSVVPVTAPDYDGDFREGTIGPEFLQGHPTVIAVVKKNAVVLRRLRDWLQRRPRDAHLPLLLIDDEADQASINTGGERIEDDEGVSLRERYDLLDDDVEPGVDGSSFQQIAGPSAINGLIRQVLKGFNQAAYVAYTATPFANILIDPSAVDLEAGEGLYPRDFIISLSTPANYVGAEQLFGIDPESDPIDIVSSIPESDAILVSARSADDEVQMVDSLRTALIDFLLAAAAKDHRIGISAATMLVHTTYRIDPQIAIGRLLEDEIVNLRSGWKYDGDYREELRLRWESEFENRTGFDGEAYPKFDELYPSIDSLLRTDNAPSVVVFNSETDAQLEFDVHPERKVMLVGGNRLARGLTLEGLLVSYFTRQSGTYDTVMQAARWFGYHDDYHDLTRIWLTDENYSRFRHLAKVEDDLFRQIALYSLTGKRPSERSPLILSHPEMQVTATNKSASAQVFDADYSGHFLQSVRLPLDSSILLESNLAATRQFIGQLEAPPSHLEEEDSNTWRDVPFELVTSYLGSFETDGERFDTFRLIDYIDRMANDHNELLRWWVSIRARGTMLPSLGVVDLGSQAGSVNAISRSRLTHDRGSLGALANPVTVEGSTGDEIVGLARDVVESVREDFRSNSSQDSTRFSTVLRSHRNPEEGLLCIYPVSANSKAGDRAKNRDDLFGNGRAHPPVIGLAVLFPPSRAAREAVRIGGPLGGRGR